MLLLGNIAEFRKRKSICSYDVCMLMLMLDAVFVALKSVPKTTEMSGSLTGAHNYQYTFTIDTNISIYRYINRYCYVKIFSLRCMFEELELAESNVHIYMYLSVVLLVSTNCMRLTVCR